MKYVRIETFEVRTGKTIGGYISSISVILYRRLKLDPGCEIDELITATKNSTDTEIKYLLSLVEKLVDIPRPDVYLHDMIGCICMYKKDEFARIRGYIEYINMMLYTETHGKAMLIYKEFDIPDEDLLYQDVYQIVVSRSTYDRLNDNIGIQFFDRKSWIPFQIR